MKVKKGNHKGESGIVYFYRREGDHGRLTLITPSGKHIYVNSDEIDYKFTTVSIELMMDAEERAAFRQRIKEIKENMDEEYGG